MRARLDHRGYSGRRGDDPLVRMEMQLSEFREHVEWLERLRPEDGCTQDWRRQLDELDPPLDPVAV